MESKIHPELLTPAERLDEITRILSQGFFRKKERINSADSSACGDNSLDLPARKSVHDTTTIKQ